MRVYFYDCLDQAELGEAASDLACIDWTSGSEPSDRQQTLYVYNHTDWTGKGYHFDALVRTATCGHDVESASPAVDDVLRAQECTGRAQVPSAGNGEGAAPQVPAVDEVETILGDFFRSRGARLTITRRDAAAVVAGWYDGTALMETLHTLLQAGLVHADSGQHAARRLVDQWRAYWAVRTGGPGRPLGSQRAAPEPERWTAQKRTESEESVMSAKRRPPGKGPGQEPRPGPGEQQTGPARPQHSTKRRWEAAQAKAEPAGNTWQDRRAEEPHAKDRSTWRPTKRLRRKTSVAASQSTTASGEVLDDDQYVLQVQTVEKSKDHRRTEELRIERLSEAISERPTLPWKWQKMDAGVAYDLPYVHCSFKSCEFQADNDEALAAHIVVAHDAAFAGASEVTLTEAEKLRAYQAAVTWRCQQGAPVANVSIDRRALRLYRESLEGDNVSSLLCFVCAQKYPHAKTGRNQPIRWIRPLDSEGTSVFGLSVPEAEKVLGIEAYVNAYVAGATVFAQAEMKKELRDWSCVVNLQGRLLTLLCCPEDKQCQKRCKPEEMCTKCCVPVCNGCRRALLWEGKQPAAALSNDMMVYYAPHNIFEREVTVMEMLCASPCLTTMVCFSLEQRLRGDRALDQDQWMNRNRLVARGNATTFPLAWEDLLQQMQQLEAGNNGAKHEKNKGGLPHCGEALRQIASVIVKSAHAKSDDLDIGVRSWCSS